MSAGDPCTCKYVTLVKLSDRGTFSRHWYIAQNFLPIFSMFVFFRGSFKTAIFSKILKVTIATSNFISKVYNSRFLYIYKNNISIFFLSIYINDLSKNLSSITKHLADDTSFRREVKFFLSY